MTIFAPLYPQSFLELPDGSIALADSQPGIDIETGFDDDDFISIALPDFPLDDIDLAASNIQFTSNAESPANFAVGPTATVAFSESLTTLVNGDSEFRFERELLNAIDLSAITGVRFSIEATGVADFRVLAIRCLHKDWVYAPIDTETRYNRAVWPVPLDGGAAPSYDFPTADDPWPILFRADDPSGEGDPRPIDAHLSMGFNTGTGAGVNRLSLFLRERRKDSITQLELNGMTMDELNGNPQPNEGEALWIARVQKDLDGIDDTVVGPGVDPGATIGGGLTQADLNGRTQADLGRKPDHLNATWIEARLTWETGEAYLEIYDAETPGAFYDLPVELLDSTDYVMFVELEDRTFRARIFKQVGNQTSTLVFDSDRIEDPAIFKRRKGRIGWSADFEDGDAYLSHIRSRYLNFAEYRSLPFKSISYVEGAQLQASASPDSDLFQGIYAGPWGGDFFSHPERGPEAYRVRNLAEEPLQGIQTQPIYFDDFENTEISYEILLTQQAVDAGSVSVFLWDGEQALALPATALQGGVYNRVEIDLSVLAPDTIPGYYMLVIVQGLVGLPNDWIIDKISVKRRNIWWRARSSVADAWELHEEDWIPFKSALNHSYGGVLFHERSNALQVQGKALRQDAFIDKVRITPKYAELGRIVWEDEGHQPVSGSAPVASFDYSLDGTTLNATSTATDTNGHIANHTWTFGDGNMDSGKNISHTYEVSGSYPVTLTVTDNHGEQDSETTVIAL